MVTQYYHGQVKNSTKRSRRTTIRTFGRLAQYSIEKQGRQQDFGEKSTIVRLYYSTPSALNTASSALLQKIKIKLPTNSGGTDPRSAALVIGSRTFFAPLSRQTCKLFASSSTQNCTADTNFTQNSKRTDCWPTKRNAAQCNQSGQCQLSCHRTIRRKINVSNTGTVQQFFYRLCMVRLHIIHCEDRIIVQMRRQNILQILSEMVYCRST